MLARVLQKMQEESKEMATKRCACNLESGEEFRGKFLLNISVE